MQQYLVTIINKPFNFDFNFFNQLTEDLKELKHQKYLLVTICNQNATALEGISVANILYILVIQIDNQTANVL